ncbi:BA75_03897T0 [Komagataella pastoris]|uniref:BA75_03897T0 n=1 Tax=Komagataella pastoris TaxID=4922 RepID=A0A1B2JFH3_PICPA|nr:BA75_03897T0 [Komagataella pastoris]
MGEHKSGSSPSLRVSSFDDSSSVAIGNFFNGLSIPSDTEFELYQTKSKKHPQYLIHGENERLLYDGQTDPEDNSNYCVAIYDPDSASVELYKAPLIVSQVSSKLKRKSSGPAVKQAGIHARLQRNALGQAFGTKKAKKAITSNEINKVDASKLEGSALDIVDSIKSTTEQLPSREELETKLDEFRPVPPYNLDATHVEDIYPLEGIISSHEWKYLRVDAILAETDWKKRLELFPFQDSHYIRSHLEKFTLDKNAQKKTIQLLYYLSVLLGTYRNRRLHQKQALMEALQDPPESLINGVLKRFTVVKAGLFGRRKDQSFLVDPQNEDKLLGYILALILHIDSFMIEIPPLSQELSLKSSKLSNLLKVLGCTIKPVTAAEAEVLGVKRSEMKTHKVAVLRVPFKLPEITRRKRRN